MKTMRLAHIVNPVKVGPESDLFLAQPVTFASLLQAREAAPGDLDVTLLAAGFPEDLECLPQGIHATQPLERSIREAAGFNESHRRLPFLQDILERLLSATDAENLIYSNVDIAVLPEFYTIVAGYLREGIDAFVINRRTISGEFSGPEQLPDMITQARNAGAPHPGYDCFVFRRRAAKRFNLGKVCVGANWSGRAMLANMLRFSRNYREFRDLHLTFHLGDRREWLERRHDPYNHHNATETDRILAWLARSADRNQRKQLRTIGEEMKPTSIPDDATPGGIIELHTPSRRAAGIADSVFPNEFRHSSSWEHFPRQFLRQDPVFVVGFPRSGTTLVQALLATQHGLVTFPETHFFSIVRSTLIVNDDRIDAQCLDRAIRCIRQRVEFSIQAEASVRQTASTIGLSPKMLFETLVLDILVDRVPRPELARTRWMEKTPDHIHHLEVIRRFYPSARIVCVLRDPEKAILSRKRYFHFNRESEWPVERHVRDWLRGIQALELLQHQEPGIATVVRLEELVQDTEKTLHKICAFLGLDFDPTAMNEYRQTAKQLVYPWETWKSGVFQEISPQIAGCRKTRMNWRQRTMLDFLGGSTLARYGYTTLPRRGLSALAQMLRRIKHSIHAGANRPQAAPIPQKSGQGEWPAKIDMGNQAELFYGKHRHGWTFAVRSLSPLHRPGGVELDSFIERTFAWSSAPVPHTRPWVGIIHVPPNVPDWFQFYQSNDAVFASEAWQSSLPFCRGLFTLSRYHRRHLEKRLEIPVGHLYFPTEFPEQRWSWQRFRANRDPFVVQIGWWLRRIHAIFQLPTAGTGFRKLFLKVDHFDWDYLIRRERDILVQQGEFEDGMYAGTEQLTFLPNSEYDRLLSENVVFLNLYDSSANNTVIECMARATPILINPLEAVREYLGHDYPLYYRSLTEAGEILRDRERIHAAHLYLLRPDIRESLRPERFLRDFAASDIYRNL